ncbi:MAG TPA: glycine betaine ABC transporter substrate-binding protein, partial [Paraburkholderia sp.]|nr:glycine betaine ABC transporter substrate-binding protein [Paraburkholderia sp.]
MMNLFKRSRWITAGALLLTSLHASAATLVLGGKNFTEQYVLTEITSQYLRSKGY